MSSVENDNATPSWLDEKFIETILRRKKNDNGLCIRRIACENAVPKGENYGSIIRRVSVEYFNTTEEENRNENKTCSLIVKSLPIGEVQKTMMEFGVFDREQHIYEVTLQLINNLYLEKTSEIGANLAPDVYPTDVLNMIVLEDLRPLGYKMADRRQGLDLDHSKMAIRALGKLHASSMVLYVENPEALEYYKEPFYTEEKRQLIVNFLEKMLYAVAAEVETWEGYERYAEKVKMIASTCVDRSIALMKNEEGAMKVLNHGDFWTNNMVFAYEDGRVADVKMLDFQVVRFASPGIDIQYFLHTSPSQDILEDNWDLLVEEYLNSLNETLRKLKDSRVITLEELNKELKSKAYFGVLISFLYCIIVAEPEDAPELSDILGETQETSGNVPMINKLYAGKKYRSVLQRRLQKFEEQGLI